MDSPRISPYDPEAPRRYEEEAERIRSAIAGTIAIEHVGSTAVPSLAGKGTIDMALGVGSLDLSDEDFKRMYALGYTYGGTHDQPQHVFRRGETSPREFLVHVVIHDGQMWRDFLTFRDHLRAAPEDAAAYAALKAKLLVGREGWYSGRDKEAFIAPILARTGGGASTPAGSVGTPAGWDPSSADAGTGIESADEQPHRQDPQVARPR